MTRVDLSRLLVLEAKWSGFPLRSVFPADAGR